MDANRSAETAARLVIEQGPEPGQIFLLGGAPQTVGRSANNGIVINDPEISRRHAQITPQGDGYVVEDLGSTNGSFVNGIRLDRPMALRHGDTVAFGDMVQLRYWAAGKESETVDTPVLPVPTPELPPQQEPIYEQPDMPPPLSSAEPLPVSDYFDGPETAAAGRRNRLLIGCGCLLLLGCVLCVGGVFALDSYDQGRLLYCGGLRPFWEVVLGPLGFNPVCP